MFINLQAYAVFLNLQAYELRACMNGTDTIASLGAKLSDWLNKDVVFLNLRCCSRLVELGSKRLFSSDVCKDNEPGAAPIRRDSLT